MPVPDWPGRAQGAAPKVSETLNTFFPDALGAMVPLNLHPDEPVAVNAPVDATLRATLSPPVLVVDHTPETAVRYATAS